MVWCSLLVMEYAQREHHFLKQNPLTWYLENKKEKLRIRTRKRSGKKREKNVPLQKLLGKLSFMAFSVQSLGGAQEELLGSPSGSAAPRALSCAGTPTSFLRCTGAAAKRSIISKLFKKAYIIPHPSTNDEGFLKTYWRANSSQDFWARKQTF